MRSAFLTAAFVGVSFGAMAQSPGSIEAEFKYAKEYLATQKYLNASRGFETITRRWPANAEGHLLLGQCYAELGRYADARAELTKAVELNPGFKPQAEAFLALADSREKAAKATSNPTVTNTASASPAKPATAAPPAAGRPEPPRSMSMMAPAPLVYGDYVCTLNTWNVSARRMDFLPKGTIQINANGTYRYLDGGTPGRYAYNPSTRQITWLTGYFAERGQPKTTYTPLDKTVQLEVEFATASDSLSWTCGCNRK